MARPRKQTVDYFPHDTDASLSSKETIPALETRWGNDGYAFWFKLLELLGRSPGLYYNFSTPRQLEKLRTQTRQKDTETILEMLKLLDTLEAIDHELYMNGIIWCQNFSIGVKDAFVRSIDGAPEKPDFGFLLAETPEFNTETQESNTETPQNKIKENKGNKNKVNIYSDKDYVNYENNGAGTIWVEALAIIKEMVSEPNYRTWFEKTKGVRYDKGSFVILAPNGNGREYLCKNAYSVIEKALLDLIEPGTRISVISKDFTQVTIPSQQVRG